MRSSVARPVCTTRGSNIPSARFRKTRVLSPVASTAARGIVSTRSLLSASSRTVATIPGLSASFAFGSSTRMRTVRVSVFSVG